MSETRLAVISKKQHLERLRKLIADEALPIETRPVLCSPNCPEDCEGHVEYLEVWTWALERKLELSNMILAHVFKVASRLDSLS